MAEAEEQLEREAREEEEQEQLELERFTKDELRQLRKIMDEQEERRIKGEKLLELCERYDKTTSRDLSEDEIMDVDELFISDIFKILNS
jgi:hypothetical protein